jgi:cell shape-determining protein MreC
MEELRKITAGENIYSKESKEYQDKLSYLISRHNMLCSIEKAFNDNPEALRCFNEAVEEVLESGNQSISSMFAIAIERLSEKAEAYEKDNPDVSVLKSIIHKLEAENTNLRARLDMVAELVERQKKKAGEV